MKKILTFSIVCALSLPIFVLAVTPGQIPAANDYGIDVSGLPTTTQGILNIFASVVGWVYTTFFVLAVLFVIFAAFDYLTGGDNPEKIKTAHKKLIYAAIAIGVALLAVLVQVIIGNFIKVNNG